MIAGSILIGGTVLCPEEDTSLCLELIQPRECQPALQKTRPRGYKTFSMLNSAEHEVYPAHKC